jgi:hypothetical protein
MASSRLITMASHQPSPGPASMRTMFPAAIDSQFCGRPDANGGKMVPVSAGDRAASPFEKVEEAADPSPCERSLLSRAELSAATSFSYRSRLMFGMKAVARQSGWEHSDNQDGHFGGRGGRMIVAARR